MYSLLIHGRKSLLRGSVQNAFTSSFTTLREARKGILGKNLPILTWLVGLTPKQTEWLSRIAYYGQDSVVILFRLQGLTDSQIDDIRDSYPHFLKLRGPSLSPKLRYLQSRGVTSFELYDILLKIPEILEIKGPEITGLYYDVFKDITAADKSSTVGDLALSTLPKGGKQENVMRNVRALRALGVPQKVLLSLLTSDVKLVYGKRRFEETVKLVLGKGFDPTKPKFVEALKIIYKISDRTDEEKINIYTRLGFAEEDVWYLFKKFPRILTLSEKNTLNFAEAFLGLGFSTDEFKMMLKRHPSCITYSAELATKKIEFLVKNMNWPLAGLRPKLLSYSMEERIVPRCNIVCEKSR
ncbi:uncharacterized protein LOC17885876 isoform X2 [Capsella rubella]|uniref:uncharacterized protein LOC17885876 isoform X2 n=1 Tax=Capsella rubella TaxID=81985 RepID=UPI000CD5A71D|nr:uncharacterized protein LOC17885876 isoform X2 [Capsella rubella]